MKSYMTRKGSCSFGSDKLVFEESLKYYFSNMIEGFWENGGKGDKLFLMASIALMSYAVTYSAILLLLGGRRIQSILLISILVFGVLVWFYHRIKGVAKVKAVKFDSIDSVRYMKGRKAISNPRFLIRFQEDGDEKIRYLIMPNRLMPGIEDEIKEVKQEFKDRDIRVES